MIHTLNKGQIQQYLFTNKTLILLFLLLFSPQNGLLLSDYYCQITRESKTKQIIGTDTDK